MKIYGKDIKFRMTIGAASKIAAACPGHDIGKLDSLLSGSDFVKQAEVLGIMAEALNEGYAATCKFEGGEEPARVTRSEIESLDFGQFEILAGELMTAMTNDMKTTVQVEPEKKEKATG